MAGMDLIVLIVGIIDGHFGLSYSFLLSLLYSFFQYSYHLLTTHIYCLNDAQIVDPYPK